MTPTELIQTLRLHSRSSVAHVEPPWCREAADCVDALLTPQEAPGVTSGGLASYAPGITQDRAEARLDPLASFEVRRLLALLEAEIHAREAREREAW